MDDGLKAMYTHALTNEHFSMSGPNQIFMAKNSTGSGCLDCERSFAACSFACVMEYEKRSNEEIVHIQILCHIDGGISNNST